MNTYVAVVVGDRAKAYEALHGLWELDARGDLTVQGAVVVSRDRWGHIDVRHPANHRSSGEPDLGVGIGLLLGSLASPHAGLHIPNGGWAVIAGIAEDAPEPLDALSSSLDGSTYRRSKVAVDADTRLSTDFDDYLYPYEYQAGE
ncbi:MAG: hypothetical protein JO199_04990 [Candidatus Eremiobacteraeota bacterium]|nr:hypothetical protein [Candidatus Eremiobacteraeota bacterium]